MIRNKRPGGIPFSSRDRDCHIAFRQAKGTIRLDPVLTDMFHVQEHVRKITHRHSGATLMIKAADTDVITGSKALGTMIDETHVFAKRANARDVFVELRGALTKRPDGFLFQTTTQSKAPPSGVFATELSMARQVRDGKVVGMRLLPVLYELPDHLSKNNGWKERKYWPLVNEHGAPEARISMREIKPPERRMGALLSSQSISMSRSVSGCSMTAGRAGSGNRAEDGRSRLSPSSRIRGDCRRRRWRWARHLLA
jgi:hypothetical protein